MEHQKKKYLFDNKALAALMIPLIIEQALAVLVGMADSIMVASVGESAVSGVSLVDNIMVLLINIFAALATGGAVVVGQYLGQQRREKACKASSQLVWFITIVAVVITMIVYIGKDFILHGVFGKIDSDVMGYAKTYLLIVTASIPFIALYNGGAAIFRAMGNSKISMQISIIMNIINVVGNAILIYGFHWGTEGVAIPTLVSRIVAALLITIFLCDQSRTLHIEKSFRYHFDWGMVKKILYIGVPNGMENSMFQLGKILVLSLISSFG
ncbi:MAG: MATE family efflux transporter, partial [Lachnospiraceae bacterium]